MTPLHDTQNESVWKHKEEDGEKKGIPEHQSLDSIKVTLVQKKRKEKGGGRKEKKRNSSDPNPSPSPLCGKVLCDSGWQSKHSSCATAMYKNTAKRQNIGVSLFKWSG